MSANSKTLKSSSRKNPDPIFNSKDIKITRIYDAPVKLVWEAWTDPEQTAKWWGPRGFTLTNHSKDLRVGGHWAYTMHGPDGTNYPNRTTYHEVEEFKRLVYDHGASEDRPPLFRVTVTFTEIKEKTKMDMTMSLPTPEAVAQTREFIKKAGGNATWDRLAEFLEKEESDKDVFVINRSFNVSIEKMFELWTERDHFSKWLPPTGFSMEFIECNIKEGGTSFYKMSNGTNVTMYGKIHYKEIRRPDRLLYTQQFTDEKGNISRHPFAPTWPETMLTSVSFTEEGPESTRITVKWEPYGKATTEEIETFAKARAGMTQGWTGSFDKLEEYLGTL